MSEISDVRADVISLIATVSDLNATLRSHLQQQAERTQRRDAEIAGVRSEIREVRDEHTALVAEVRALADWRIRTGALAGAIGALASVLSPQIQHSITTLLRG